MNLIRKYLTHIELLFLFLLSLTPILWLKGEEVIIGHDTGARLNGAEYLRDLFYAWNPNINFGRDWVLNKGFLITKLPEIIPTIATGSLGIGERFMFVFWFFVMGLSMYIFTWSFFKERKYWVLRIVASIFYMYNFFILQAWLEIDRAKFSIYASLPLILLVLYKTLTQNYSIKKGAILFGLIIFFFNGGSSPPLFGSLILSVGVFITYFMIKDYKINGYKAIIYGLKVLTSFTAFSFLINAYWTIPQLGLVLNKYNSTLAGVGGVAGALSWEKLTTHHASFLNLLRLQGIPDWYDNPYHTFSLAYLANPILIVLSFLPFAIFLFAFSKNKLTRHLYHPLIPPIILILIIGLIFTSGSQTPLGFIYTFAVEHIPGFAMFRSAFSKFGTAVWFSIIFLFSYSLNILFLNYFPKKKLLHILGIFTIIVILIYHYPFFQGKFFSLQHPFSTKVEIPNYVTDSISYLSKTKNQHILLLPPFEAPLLADAYTWGYLSTAAFLRNSRSGSVVANDDKSPEIIGNVYHAIATGDQASFSRAISIAGIDTILWRDDILYSHGKTGKEMSQIEQNLLTFSQVNHEASFKDWRIYHVTGALPIVYGADKIIKVHGPSPHIGSIHHLANISTSSAIVFQDDIKESKNLPYSMTVYPAVCIQCNLSEQKKLEKQLFLPPVRILPDSFLYQFIISKEIKQKQNFSGNNPALIDLEISLAGKRLSEIKQLISNKAKPSLISSTFDRYKNHLRFISKLVPTLSGKQYNEYALKLLAYLSLHKKELKSFGKIPMEIYSLEENLKLKVWKTTSKNNARLIASVPQTGLYQLKIGGNLEFIETISINNKKILPNDDVTLSNGDHFVEINYKSPRDKWTSIFDDPQLFLFQNSSSANKGDPVVVEAQRKDSTFYLVDIPNAKSPTVIVFGESYDSEWNLYEKRFDFDVLNQFLLPILKPVPSHFKVNGFANAWVLPDSVGESKSYIIAYRAQWLGYLGVFVTFVSFIFALWTVRKFRNNK